MDYADARDEIALDWRSLPEEQRQTDERAAPFAMQTNDKYKSSNESADHIKLSRVALLSYRSLTRGLE
jgi:hypothetical protein